MKEIWKDIPNYEEWYQVSNFGRVKSLNRIINTIEGKVYHRKERVLSPSLSQKASNVILSKEGHKAYIQIDILVAQVFIPNPQGYQYVLHKNKNPQDNRATNLEWTPYRIPERNKPVYQYTLDGIFIKRWDSVLAAAQNNGFSVSGIQRSCSNKQHTYKDFIWTYKPLTSKDLKSRLK